MTIRLSILIFCVAFLAHGQMPPPRSGPVLVYMAVQNTDGTNFSQPSNEVSLPMGVPAGLSWVNPSPALDTVLLTGRRAGRYTLTNSIGHTNQTAYPQPIPPTVTTLSCGGQPFFSVTGAPACDVGYFKAYQSSNLGAVSISHSSDMMHWTSGYALLLTTGHDFTITRQ